VSTQVPVFAGARVLQVGSERSMSAARRCQEGLERDRPRNWAITLETDGGAHAIFSEPNLLGRAMTRAQTIDTIRSKLASLEQLDDHRLASVAEFLDALTDDSEPIRQLTPRERALVDQSRADFAEGRTLSADEARARTDAYLAERRRPRPTP
jgi:hypothetical protein